MVPGFFLALFLAAAADPLADLGIHVTKGAAPGYVADEVCGNCHRDRFTSYQHVGMAQSFYRPRASRLIENFEAPPFFHERSKQYFEMRRRGDQLFFRRYQLAADGAPIHVIELPVEWILGSGHHARSYLYRMPNGELFLLPICWYTEAGEWGMAPGYDRPDHPGLMRVARHECMFCHNGYPEIEEETRSYWRSQSLPEHLPEGTGCQRCHGPGANHVAAVMGGNFEAIKKAIVNPARLEPPLRMDVCYECHLQPAIALAGSRRFGRDIYSFRPGQSLYDYEVPLDITESDLPKEDRFEINHHPYRLEQSRCFRESNGRLDCLTCHDPHRKVPPEQRAAHYRKACMGCHEKPHHVDRDCTTCHMPNRRPQDVVHVVMTDHFIRRTPGGPELVAPLDERDPSLAGVELLNPGRSPTGALGSLYQVISFLRLSGGTNPDAVQRLERLLAEVKPKEIEPYLDLANVQFRTGRYAELEKTTRSILERAPGDASALGWLGFARLAQGDHAAGIQYLEESLRKTGLADTEYNLGLALLSAGRTEEANARFEHALTQRPNLVAAWLKLGDARRECGDLRGAIDAYRRALQLEPRERRATAAIVDALTEFGDLEEAARYSRTE